MKRLPSNLMLAGAAMSAAVSALALFASSLEGIGAPAALLLVFVASFMTWIPVREEHGLVFAAIEYLAVVIIALLICDGVWRLLYILLFGHYPIFKHFVELRERDVPLRYMLKFLYLNCFIAIGVATAQYGFGIDIATFVPEIPIWALILGLQAALLLYELLYSFLASLFDGHARRIILPRR